MFDLGWSEMLLIGIVALVVVGPKELPGLFRSIGLAVGKARGLAREFSRAMEAAADESGMKEIDKTIRAATKPVQFATDRLREQTGAGGRKPAIPPLNPGAPLPASPPAEAVAPAEGPAAPTLAPAAPVAWTATVTATEALAQRRAEERAALVEAAPRPAPPRPAPPGEGG